MEAKDPSGLEQQLQYDFNNKDLLQEALRHSSYVNELAHENLKDNERFEFLGDAVLGFLNAVKGHGIPPVLPPWSVEAAGSRPARRCQHPDPGPANP